MESGYSTASIRLADTLACSQRTVFRDISPLRASEYQLSYNRPVRGYNTDNLVPASTDSPNDVGKIALMIAALVAWPSVIEAIAYPVRQVSGQTNSKYIEPYAAYIEPYAASR